MNIISGLNFDLFSPAFIILCNLCPMWYTSMKTMLILLLTNVNVAFNLVYRMFLVIVLE